MSPPCFLPHREVAISKPRPLDRVAALAPGQTVVVEKEALVRVLMEMDQGRVPEAVAQEEAAADQAPARAGVQGVNLLPEGRGLEAAEVGLAVEVDQAEEVVQARAPGQAVGVVREVSAEAARAAAVVPEPVAQGAREAPVVVIRMERAAAAQARAQVPEAELEALVPAAEAPALEGLPRVVADQDPVQVEVRLVNLARETVQEEVAAVDLLIRNRVAVQRQVSLQAPTTARATSALARKQIAPKTLPHPAKVTGLTAKCKQVRPRRIRGYGSLSSFSS